MNTLRRMLATTAVALAGFTSLAVTPPARAAEVTPAAVNTVYCNGMTWFTYFGLWATRPTDEDGDGDTNCVMSFGVTGNGVRELRLSLAWCYNYVTDYNAGWDQELATVIMYLQALARSQGHDIAVDGIFGPQTSSVLKWHQFYANGKSAGCSPGVQ